MAATDDRVARALRAGGRNGHLRAQPSAQDRLSQAAKLDTLAGRLERSSREIGMNAFAVRFRQEEVRHRLTLEALADVDFGQVIDHQAVQAWADSLGSRKPLPPPRR